MAMHLESGLKKTLLCKRPRFWPTRHSTYRGVLEHTMSLNLSPPSKFWCSRSLCVRTPLHQSA